MNGDGVAGAPLTLDLQGVPERQALDIILRGVSGYVLAARQLGTPNTDAIGRVIAGASSEEKLAFTRFGIAEVILLPLRVGDNILRRHQPGIVAQFNFATEMMRTYAGFHADQARRHIG